MAKKSWRKASIIENLELRGIPVPDGVQNFQKLTIPSLIALSESHKIQTKFVIEQLAEESHRDIKVLWLPVAHCEFNPIELVWSNVKRYVAKHNKFGGPDVINVVHEALSKVTPDLWSAFCGRAIQFENIMRERDGLIEKIIYCNDNDDNNTEEEMDDDIEVEVSSSSSDSDSLSDSESDF
jgi:transposase